MKKSVIGGLLIIFAAFLWALDGIVLTPRLFNLNVMFVVFMLHLTPFVLLNIFFFKEYRWLSKFTRSDIITLCLIAIFGGALGTLAIVKALFLVNFQQLSVVILLQKLQPVFAITLAAILLKEKIKRSFIYLAGLAVLSSYFLAFGFSLPNLATGQNTALVAMYAVIAAFSFGSSTVFSKKILNKYPFYTANFYRFGLTALIMFVVVLLTNNLGEIYKVTPVNWGLFLLIAVTTGSGAILIYYYGLRHVKATVSTICELAFPVSAVILDYFINGTILTPVQWASAIIMLLVILKINHDYND